MSLSQFHSPLTKQRLSLIKPPVPSFPYSTIEEINQKYKTFVQANEEPFRRQSFIDASDSQPHMPMQLRRSLFRGKTTKSSNYMMNLIYGNPNPNPSQNFGVHSTNATMIKYKREESDPAPLKLLTNSSNFSNSDNLNQLKTNKNLLFSGAGVGVGVGVEMSELARSVKGELDNNNKPGKVSKIVKHFGEEIIGAIFQGLVMRSLEELRLMRGEGEVMRKMLEFFEISPIKMRTMKTQSERNDYIIAKMNEGIDRMLKNWREKIEHQERTYLLGKREYALMKEKNEKEIGDRFKWLNLKTKYENLRNKLKTLIIQKLNDYEVQMSVIQTLKARDERLKNVGRIPYDEMRISFANVETPNCSSLINNFHSPVKSAKKLKYNMRHNSIETRASTEPSTILNSQTSQISDYLTSSLLQSSSFTGSSLLQHFTWDASFETNFKNYIQQSRQLFHNELKTSNFDEIGVMYMMQNLFKDQKKHKEREILYKRYAEGGPLTAEEVKFLADSSELLNACVDKNYIKKIVSLLDNDVLHYLELNLAESVISKYNSMREIIVQSRGRFIRERNEQIKREVEEKTLQYERNREIIQNRKKGKRFIKTVASFNKKFLSRGGRRKESQISKEEGYMKSKEIDLYMDEKNPNLTRHKYHPSSKLFYLNKKELTEKDQKYLLSLEDEKSKFKLQIKSPTALKLKDNFFKYYSGGPEKNDGSSLLIKLPEGILRPPTSFELHQIIKIQRLFRGKLIRNNFRALIHAKLNSGSTLKSIQSLNFSTPSSPLRKKRKSVEEILQEDIASSAVLREQKIINKPPPKNLLLKHRKLLEAAKTNNIYMARNSGFVYYSNDMNVRDKKSNVALYYTAKSGNMEFCSYLIELGAKVNEVCEEGNTPFHMAFWTNSFDIIMLMLENGGDLNTLNHSSQTPLAFASKTTLKRLDLEEGIATISNKKTSSYFDNNRLLDIDKERGSLKLNENCFFTMDKLKKSTIEIRDVNETFKGVSLVSFGGKKEGEATRRREDESEEACSIHSAQSKKRDF